MTQEEIKTEIFSFLNFKKQFQINERVRFHAECLRLGGMFSYIGASDEHIYEKWIEEQKAQASVATEVKLEDKS